MSKARIKLICDDIKKINKFVSEVVTITEKLGVSMVGPIPLPTKKLKVTTRKSPDGEGKASFERYQMRIHKRVLDVEINDRVIRMITKVHIPTGLNIEIKFENTLESYEIPPMTLQLLIENAVKHNVVSTKDPLQISISQNGDTLSVKNIKSTLISPSQGTKTGLTNIKRRFELINLPTPIIRETDEEFEILLKMKQI